MQAIQYLLNSRAEPTRPATGSPSVMRASSARQVDGEPAWVIWYRYDEFLDDTCGSRYRTEWIARENRRRLRQVTYFCEAPGPMASPVTVSITYPDP